MIFNSLFNLIETDTDGVYKFICRFFYERSNELCIEDKLYVYAVLKKFCSEKEKDEDNFLKLFENKKILLKTLSQLTGSGEFNIFTNNKDVQYSQLSDDVVNIACIYAEIFTTSNIKNPDEDFCKKLM